MRLICLSLVTLVRLTHFLLRAMVDSRGGFVEAIFNGRDNLLREFVRYQDL